MTLAAASDATDRSSPIGLRGCVRSVSMAMLGPVLVVVLSILRSPDLMMRGHLWAEDAFFLSHMLTTRSVLSGIFYIYNGHLELLNSIVFFVASHLKLKMVPLMTTYCAILIECLLAFVIVFFRTDLGIRFLPALLIGMLIVVSPCASEHQLNMLNSVWLTSAILLVLINLPPGRLAGHESRVAVAALILGLSGIPATCLTPVAVLHAVAWRSRPHATIAGALVVGGLVQAALVLLNGTHDRFGSVNLWVYIAAPFFHVVVEHLSGVEAASVLSFWFQQSRTDTSTVLSLMLAPIALLAWIVWQIVRGEDLQSRLLLATFVYVVLFNIAFAIGDRNDLFSIYGMRYFFLPALIIALVIARAGGVSTRWPPRFILGLLAFVTVLSTKDFFLDGYNGAYVTQQRDWRRDVERCEIAGGPCRIEVDPGGYYAVDVPDPGAR